MILIAKFLPRIDTCVVRPAAASGITLPVVLLCEISGGLSHIGVWLARTRIEALSSLAHFATSVSAGFAVLGTSLVACWYGRRRRLRRLIRSSGISPQELYILIRRGSDPLIVDLRHPLDAFTDPVMIPGAIRLLPDKLRVRESDLPRDRDIILYCTCPDEDSSVDSALKM